MYSLQHMETHWPWFVFGIVPFAREKSARKVKIGKEKNMHDVFRKNETNSSYFLYIFLLLECIELARSTSNPNCWLNVINSDNDTQNKTTTKLLNSIYWSGKFQEEKNQAPNDNPQFNRENGRNDERNFAFENVTHKKIWLARGTVSGGGKKSGFTHVDKNITDKTTCQLRRNRLANSNDGQPQRDRLKPAKKKPYKFSYRKWNRRRRQGASDRVQYLYDSKCATISYFMQSLFLLA